MKEGESSENIGTPLSKDLKKGDVILVSNRKLEILGSLPGMYSVLDSETQTRRFIQKSELETLIDLEVPPVSETIPVEEEVPREESFVEEPPIDARESEELAVKEGTESVRPVEIVPDPYEEIAPPLEYPLEELEPKIEEGVTVHDEHQKEEESIIRESAGQVVSTEEAKESAARYAILEHEYEDLIIAIRKKEAELSGVNPPEQAQEEELVHLEAQAARVTLALRAEYHALGVFDDEGRVYRRTLSEIAFEESRPTLDADALERIDVLQEQAYRMAVGIRAGKSESQDQGASARNPISQDRVPADDLPEVVTSVEPEVIPAPKPEATISQHVLEQFESRTGLSRDDLMEVPGFSELSSGAQTLALRNYEDLLLTEVTRSAREQERSEGKTAVLKRIGLSILTLGSYANFRRASLEREHLLTARGMSGDETSRLRAKDKAKDALATLVELAKNGPESDGGTQVSYLSWNQLAVPEGFAPHTKVELSEKLSELNHYARAFAGLPREWSFPTARPEEKEKYETAKAGYQSAQARVLEYRGSIGGEGEDLLESMHAIDERVALEQFFIHHPDAEAELGKISNRSVFRRTVEEFYKEKGAFALYGFAGRGASVALLGGVSSALGLGGVVAVAGVVGYHFSKKAGLAKVAEGREVGRSSRTEDEQVNARFEKKFTLKERPKVLGELQRELAQLALAHDDTEAGSPARKTIERKIEKLQSLVAWRQEKDHVREVKEYASAQFLTDRIHRLEQQASTAVQDEVSEFSRTLDTELLRTDLNPVDRQTFTRQKELCGRYLSAIASADSNPEALAILDEPSYGARLIQRYTLLQQKYARTVKYAEGKLSRGQIDFGGLSLDGMNLELTNKLQFFDALGKGVVGAKTHRLVAEENILQLMGGQEKQSALDSALDSRLEEAEVSRSKRLRKDIVKGVLLRAGFATGGALLSDWVHAQVGGPEDGQVEPVRDEISAEQSSTLETASDDPVLETATDTASGFEANVIGKPRWVQFYQLTNEIQRVPLREEPLSLLPTFEVADAGKISEVLSDLSERNPGALAPQDRAHFLEVIEGLKGKPDVLKAMGISSGNADEIRVGDEINLEFLRIKYLLLHPTEATPEVQPLAPESGQSSLGIEEIAKIGVENSPRPTDTPLHSLMETVPKPERGIEDAKVPSLGNHELAEIPYTYPRSGLSSDEAFVDGADLAQGIERSWDDHSLATKEAVANAIARWEIRRDNAEIFQPSEYKEVEALLGRPVRELATTMSPDKMRQYGFSESVYHKMEKSIHARFVDRIQAREDERPGLFKLIAKIVTGEETYEQFLKDDDAFWDNFYIGDHKETSATFKSDMQALPNETIGAYLHRFYTDRILEKGPGSVDGGSHIPKTVYDEAFRNLKTSRK